MRVDGASFLLAALGMYACHTDHRRQAIPEPSPAEPRVDEPSPEAAAGGVVVVDAGEPDAASPSAVAADAANDAPPAPVPSLAELQRKCRALPPASPDCSWDSRRRMCQTVLVEFTRPVAARAIECYQAVETPCDSCGVRTCTQSALAGLPRRPLAECAPVEKKATETSDESYGKLMRELCETYASGMTKQGQKRFMRCLTQNMGIGVRFCLWDPSATPCSESEPLG